MKKEKLLMKARLILRVEEDEKEELESQVLNLVLNCGTKGYSLYPEPVKIDSSDKEDFYGKVIDAFEEISLILNVIPGIGIEIDDSIYSFLEMEPEADVRRFINSLLVEM